MVRFLHSNGAEEYAARIVVFIFHNINFTTENGQWVAILFFREAIARNDFVCAEMPCQTVQRGGADIPALPRAVIDSRRKPFPLFALYVKPLNQRFFGVIQAFQFFCDLCFYFPDFLYLAPQSVNGLCDRTRDIQHHTFNGI